MDEAQFWDLIEAARAQAGGEVEARVETLRIQLQALSLAELEGFQQCYEQLLRRANRWDLWGAAYLMNGGCSDDGFRYFRDWLISEGRDRFETALADPDSLADADPQDGFELESFGYVAVEEYEAQGGGELERDVSVELDQPEGEEWEEDDLPRLFPRLAALYAS